MDVKWLSIVLIIQIASQQCAVSAAKESITDPCKDLISVNTIPWPSQIQELTNMVNVLQKKMDNCLLCKRPMQAVLCPRGYIRSERGQCEPGVTCEQSPCKQNSKCIDDKFGAKCF